MQFTDKQMIRALGLLVKGTDFRGIREKDSIQNYLLNNILQGKFDFKKGNTLAFLSETLLLDNLATFLNMRKIQYESFIGEKTFFPSTDYLQNSTLGQPSEWYTKQVKALYLMMPFYRYYF